MSDNNPHYDPTFIAFLEEMWGTGYLSPGGPEEIGRLLDGISLAGKTVLDIGCGSGGITLSLARDYDAAHVIGIDVEEPVCTTARQRVAAAGLAGRIDILQVTPGPIPLPDGSLDIVFSKDSIVHIPDKESLAHDAFRLLAPGGWFVASDWLIAHDGRPSPEMADYIRREDLDFGMASPTRYRRALAEAGFVNVTLNNRNRWYLGVARQELARMQGADRPRFAAVMGHEAVEEQIALWQAMLIVLESGEHCPHHFRGQKPV
ncbi:MAG: methyltransferase domain-containing protein [Anaerolineales bacterium]|nr:methyltransferase domain-containing protein [Anaerolineales bacterium]